MNNPTVVQMVKSLVRAITTYARRAGDWKVAVERRLAGADIQVGHVTTVTATQCQTCEDTPPQPLLPRTTASSPPPAPPHDGRLTDAGVF